MAQIEIPETEITGVCQRNGIRKLALFGSILTSRFSDSSDVDVLVEFGQAEIVASSMNASIRGESSGRTSLPKVWMWNWMADLSIVLMEKSFVVPADNNPISLQPLRVREHSTCESG